MVIKSTTIDEVSLGANTYCVAVRKAVNPKTHLPIPIGDEFIYIKEVIDIMIPWLKHLVFLSTVFKVKIILLQYHNLNEFCFKLSFTYF